MSYGSIKLILTLANPFYIVTLDFILVLPPTDPEGFNWVIIVMNKFTKRNTSIPSKII